MKRFVLVAAALASLAPFALAQEEAKPEADDSAALFASSSVLTQKTGAGIYGAVCSGCHMPEGEGAVGAGAYPALADNSTLEFPEYPIHVIVHGQAAMPPLGSVLNDEQIAAVVEYIRTHFGNDYAEPVSAEMVAGAR
jgi:mono/diheme cytochrome c family protein